MRCFSLSCKTCGGLDDSDSFHRHPSVTPPDLLFLCPVLPFLHPNIRDSHWPIAFRSVGGIWHSARDTICAMLSVAFSINGLLYMDNCWEDVWKRCLMVKDCSWVHECRHTNSALGFRFIAVLVAWSSVWGMNWGFTVVYLDTASVCMPFVAILWHFSERRQRATIWPKLCCCEWQQATPWKKPKTGPWERNGPCLIKHVFCPLHLVWSV